MKQCRYVIRIDAHRIARFSNFSDALDFARWHSRIHGGCLEVHTLGKDGAIYAQFRGGKLTTEFAHIDEPMGACASC